MEIKHIDAWEILDSRGNPTLTVRLTLAQGYTGRFAVPSGASVGANEALELRDGGTRYHGRGVRKAVDHVVNIIGPALCGQSFATQADFDLALCRLDGTGNKAKLGANAILGASVAFLKACAQANQQPLYQRIGDGQVLPIPFFNVINGGVHANNALAVQEFMLVPHAAQSFAEAMQWGTEIYHTLASNLKKEGYSTAVGDEGGFAPSDITHEQALHMIVQAIEQAGYQPGQQVSLALDCAASEFQREDGRYQLSETQILDSYDWGRQLQQWAAEYPIISLEDPMGEADWEGWHQLNEILPSNIQVVGDDLFVTQVQYLAKGINEKVANAILIKPNQVGTVTQTLEVLDLAQKSQYGTIISHRSGETEDTFIADLAVGIGAGQIKSGAPCRSERLAKYNRLIEIERSLGDKASYASLQNFGQRTLEDS